MPVLAEETAKCGVAAAQVSACDTPVKAFSQAISMASTKDRVIVFGSFVTVGAVLAFIES